MRVTRSPAASTRARSPRRPSTASPVGWSSRPAPIGCGSANRSSTSTWWPARASSSAAAAPAVPQPTTVARSGCIGAPAYAAGRMSDWGRTRSLALVGAAYLLAGAAAWATVALLDAAPLLETLIADVVATVVVWAVSEVAGNASLYDPYWSVAPPVIAIAWALSGDGDALRAAVVCGLVLAWGVRLTLNWATGWGGLGHEDWRYRQLRA